MIRLILIIFLFACLVSGQDNKIYLAYEDLSELLEQYSPHIKTLNLKRELSKTDRDLALQWINPDLVYEREHVKSDDSIINEEMFYLSKTFSMPWNYINERHYWESDTMAAALDHQYNKRKLLAKAREKYVQVGLLLKLNHRLVSISDMLSELGYTIEAQESEGLISSLEASLLSMSLFGLESEIIETELTYQHTLNSWKGDLGIESSHKIVLTDSVEFKYISVNEIDLQHIFDHHPGLNALNFKMNGLETVMSLEKGRIMPSFDLMGGYKRINQGWEGYIVGLSLPIPLLNWNKPQVEKQQNRYRQMQTKSTLYRKEIENKFDHLNSAIAKQSELLKKNRDKLFTKNMIKELVVAYREGHMTLSDFLNAVLIYRTSSRQYFDQLTLYYRNIFQMELLTGKQLVTF